VRFDARLILVALVGCNVVGCQYVRLLRPQALEQLTPELVAVVNELPEVDSANEAIVGRLFAQGGLTHATMADDGTVRAAIAVPNNRARLDRPRQRFFS
jgi:hypothetical protein